MSRHVGHRIHGHIEVYGYAQSIPEALALEAALKNVPVAAAFQPVPPTAPELSPEVEALIERDADSDMGLKAGEAS